jgi:hypothetical protein
VWVKELQCGSALAMRTRDPPIIQVEIPTEVLVEPGDYLASFDLENQFNHVRLFQEFKKYFGFALSTEEFNKFTIPSMAWGFCACRRCGHEVVAGIGGSSIQPGNKAVLVRE